MSELTAKDLAAALLASEDPSLPVRIVNYGDFRAYVPRSGELMLDSAVSPNGERVLVLEVREVDR